MTLSAGSYNFDLTAPGTNTNLPLAMTLGKNTVTSIFAVGMANGTPKIELVPAQVSGVPGVPFTGSDPRPLPADSVQVEALTPWLLSIMASAFIGAGIIFRRRAAVSGK